MWNGSVLRVRAGGRSRVVVRVLTMASVGVMVMFYFAVILVFFHNFMHSHCADAKWDLR